MRNIPTLSLLASLAIAAGCVRSGPDTENRVIKEKYVHKYGVEVKGTDWQQRGMNGKVITTLDNGVTVTKNYEAGVLTGEVTYSYPHSEKIAAVETYTNGTLLKTTHIDESGNPESESNNTPDGFIMVTSWYESGIPKSKEMYKEHILVDGDYFNESNQSESKINDGEGRRAVRSRSGELLATDTFENGMLVTKTEYFPDGSTKAVIKYANHRPHGEKKTFLQSGEPDTVEQWSNGIQHGETVTYKNGEKCAEIPYHKGIKHGVEKRYRDGNTMIEEVNWRNDCLHGPSHTYIDGCISKTTWYYQGNVVPKSTYDFNTSRKLHR